MHTRGVKSGMTRAMRMKSKGRDENDEKPREQSRGGEEKKEVAGETNPNTLLPYYPNPNPNPNTLLP